MHLYIYTESVMIFSMAIIDKQTHSDHNNVQSNILKRKEDFFETSKKRKFLSEDQESR